MDSFATAISIALQYGVPLRGLVDKFSHMRFEPSGFTKNPDIPMAKSIMDYIFRWLATKFLDGDAQREIGVVKQETEDKEIAISKKVVSIVPQTPRGGGPVTISAVSRACTSKMRHRVPIAVPS